MIALIVITVAVVLGIAYIVYGRFLTAELDIDDKRVTPSVEINDGDDFVPAKASMLLPQHFSAIAAAGPIVGPILAGMWFGWGPALLWIVLGAIFVGGIHDFLSLIASVRNKAMTIGEIVKQNLSPISYILFLSFIWIALMYIVIAFTDVTAQSFVAVSGGMAIGPGVAFASMLYLFLGVGMGLVLRYWKAPLGLTTVVFMALLFAVIWLSDHLPTGLESALAAMPVKGWEVVLIVYCAVAALLPMWLLLQPRGYLGGWFLYITLAIGVFGALFGNYDIQYPAFNLDGWRGLETGKLIFPALFITIACGACSGFHGIVSSGTTSKQIRVESDTIRVGLGSMLLEGLVAVLALVTVMILAKGDPMLKSDPNVIYANGLAKYMGILGIDFKLALTFALMAFATFVYDTLDVCTRLSRYVVQELFGWKSRTGALVSTVITLLPPFAFLMLTKEKAYIKAWPLFGTSNQLMASLTLLAVTIWLVKSGRRAIYAAIPMVFMMAVTLTSLVLQIKPILAKLPELVGGKVGADEMIVGTAAIVLFVLTIWLLYEAFVSVVLRRRREA